MNEGHNLVIKFGMDKMEVRSKQSSITHRVENEVIDTENEVMDTL